MAYGVVWFKRDLRVHDHAALHHAAQRGPVLCLYILEPGLWAQPDAAPQHLAFVRESLRDLALELRRLGLRLQFAWGDAVQVLARLHALQPFDALYAHEETGNAWTYARDLAVGRWCQAQGVGWHEFPQFGVVRRLASRDAWAPRWETFMAALPWPTPEPGSLQGPTLPWTESAWPDAQTLGLWGEVPPGRQTGGRTAGLAVLHDFLHDRCGQYRGGISSPLSAPTACSRLSPYLAHGCLGMREVVQATRQRQQALPPGWQKKGLVAFVSRLHWHCHFIQKLESEPELEWRNLHRGYDGLREDDWNPAHFAALTQGRTGWPLVDACVAMLRETGWINFRMRAMLVSVAAYPLWLHWQPVGQWLAREFLDYEPGIHWSQLQMQSGTTGINTTRVYNPIKQAQDHDPQGHFVRHWLPALRRLPDAWIFEPWRLPPELQSRYGFRVGEDWPMPVVDLAQATREAKARLHARRAQPAVRAAKAAILDKHGSRAVPPGRRAATRSSPRQAAVPAAHLAAQIPLEF